MSKKNKGVFNLYEDMISDMNQKNFDDIFGSSNNDDVETLLTSEEIVKKKKVEKRTGLNSDDDGVIEENVYFKRYTKKREHKYTEKEMEAIRSSCVHTIVHDYGEHDWYHVSDEVRAKQDQLNAISNRLGKVRRTYSRVDQYIEAMRTVYEGWLILSKSNYIHTKDEFFRLVSEGKIVSPRIIMPKLKRMDQYNLDILANYISNPHLDPSYLAPPKPVTMDSFWDDDEDDDEMIWDEEKQTMRYKTYEEIEAEEMVLLVSEEDAEYILRREEDPSLIESMEVRSIDPKLIKGYDRRKFNKKRKKNGKNKSNQIIRENLAEMLNKIQNSGYYKDHTSSYMVTHSLFEVEKKEKSFWDDIRFDGSWQSDEDMFLYDLISRIELLKQNPLNEKYLTYSDKYLSQFFETLEENEISTIDLRRNMKQSTDTNNLRTSKAERKANKKVEARILSRVSELNKSGKFKKIVEVAEKDLNKYREGE